MKLSWLTVLTFTELLVMVVLGGWSLSLMDKLCYCLNLLFNIWIIDFMLWLRWHSSLCFHLFGVDHVNTNCVDTRTRLIELHVVVYVHLYQHPFKKKCPPVIDAVNNFLLVSPVTCRHWSSDLRAASHVDWVQTWRLWSLDGLQHLRFLNNFRSANSSWRFVCGRSSDFTAAETFDSESCRRHTHWWSGLGTELWFFYGTDRNASIEPSVKICLVFRWQVSTPRG